VTLPPGLLRLATRPVSTGSAPVLKVYAPVAGEVVAVNDKLVTEPGLVNAEPTGNGWLFKMKVAAATELELLLDEAAYQSLTAGDGH
jgi:glycine cleavage system H protein